MTPEQRTFLKISAHSATIQGALGVFFLDCQARGLSVRTLEYYKQKLGKFERFLESHDVKGVEEITAQHIRAFLVYLQEEGHNPGGQHAHARTVKTWLRFLVAEGLTETTPRIRMPQLPKRILPAFSPGDVDRLISECNHARDEAMVLCLLDTGCRASEFTALNVEDVDVRSGAMTIHKGKGGKGRVVYLGVRARRMLIRYLMNRSDTSPSSPLWVSLTTGGRLTYNGLRLALRRLGQRAEVDHCHPHTFRRTFALWSLRAGMNIYALQSLMGHADLTMLRRYLALVETDLEDAHRRHGPVDAHLSKQRR